MYRKNIFSRGGGAATLDRPYQIPRFSQASVGFGPAQILALSPAAWFRLGIGITVATGVSQWSDQSGNARHLLQATGGAQPALQADGSILFDGVAQFLKCTAFTLNQPATAYLLCKAVTWVSTDSICDGNTVNTLRVFQNGGTPTIALQSGTTLSGNNNMAVGIYAVIAAVANGASSLLQVNRTAALTGNAGAGVPGGFTLGAAGNNSVFSNIQVKEVIVFGVAHTADVQAKVIGYLARLGGVSV